MSSASPPADFVHKQMLETFIQSDFIAWLLQVKLSSTPSGSPANPSPTVRIESIFRLSDLLTNQIVLFCTWLGVFLRPLAGLGLRNHALGDVAYVTESTGEMFSLIVQIFTSLRLVGVSLVVL